MEPQNKNNACVGGDAESSSAPLPSQAERRLRLQEDVTKCNQERWEKLVAEEVSGDGVKSKETESRTPSQANSSVHLQKLGKSKTHLCESTVRSSSQENKPIILPSSQRALSAGHEDRVNQNPTSAITHSATSRFGMKTFTVVPPRPAVSCDAAEAQPHADTVAAVKIDDQGNMVRTGIGYNRSGTPRDKSVDRSPGFEFWNSSKKQEGHRKGVIESDVPVKSVSAIKIDDQGNMVQAGIGYSRVGTLQVESGHKSPPFGRAREFWSTSEKQESHSRGHVEKDASVRSPATKALPLGTRPDGQKAWRAENETSRNGVDRGEWPEEPRKDLTFLKPSRRTSSLYVASAINKHSNANASPRPTYATQKSNSSITFSQLTTSQRFERPATVDSKQSAAPLTMVTNGQSESSVLSAHSAAPSRSLSYPEVRSSDSRSETVEVHALRGRSGGSRGSSVGISKMLESARNRHLKSNWVDRMSTTSAANGDRAEVKLSPPLKPKPGLSSTAPPEETSLASTIVSPKAPKQSHIQSQSKNITNHLQKYFRIFTLHTLVMYSDIKRLIQLTFGL